MSERSYHGATSRSSAIYVIAYYIILYYIILYYIIYYYIILYYIILYYIILYYIILYYIILYYILLHYITLHYIILLLLLLFVFQIPSNIEMGCRIILDRFIARVYIGMAGRNQHICLRLLGIRLAARYCLYAPSRRLDGQL